MYDHDTRVHVWLCVPAHQACQLKSDINQHYLGPRNSMFQIESKQIQTKHNKKMKQNPRFKISNFKTSKSFKFQISKLPKVSNFKTFKSFKFQISKLPKSQISNFKTSRRFTFQISKLPKVSNVKFQNFQQFQISNFKTSKKFQISNFKTSNFKCKFQISKLQIGNFEMTNCKISETKCILTVPTSCICLLCWGCQSNTQRQ